MIFSSWFSGHTLLTWPDALVTGILVSLMLWLGYQSGKSTTLQDFFLGSRKIPGWAACLSFVATEVSAITVISVPAIAYMENWEYAQFFIGSTAARLAIAYLFIPAFYKYNCVTIYEFLKHRFGPETQYTATIFFFITRLLGSGVRLMAGALAVSVMLGWSIIPAIILFTIVGIAYTIYGGIRAVVWTGVMQAIVFIVGGLLTIAYIGHLEGWGPVFHAAASAGKLQVWNWGPSWNDPQFFHKFFSNPNIVYIAILNGFFGSMAAFGTDHELMQRLLTVETRRTSQNSMIGTTLVSGLVLLIFLTVGACLFGFYHLHPLLPLPEKLDAIFPHFIVHAMPVTMRGFLLGAIVMATIHSPLASLSASFVTDIYRPLLKPDAAQDHYVTVSRISIAIFALILAVLAYGFSFFQKILWLAFKIGGVTFGSLLGVFLLGLLSTRRSNHANVIAMVFCGILNAILLTLSEIHVIGLGWTWLVLIGTAGTAGIGYFLGPILDH